MKGLSQKSGVETHHLQHGDHCLNTMFFAFGKSKEKNQGLVVINANMTALASQREIW